MPYLRMLRLGFGSNSNLRFRFDVLCPSFPAIHISKQQRRRWHEKRQNYEMKCIVGIGFGGVFCRLWHVTNTRLQLSVIAGLSRNMCPWIVVCVHITHTHTDMCNWRVTMHAINAQTTYTRSRMLVPIDYATVDSTRTHRKITIDQK